MMRNREIRQRNTRQTKAYHSSHNTGILGFFDWFAGVCCKKGVGVQEGGGRKGVDGGGRPTMNRTRAGM